MVKFKIGNIVCSGISTCRIKTKLVGVTGLAFDTAICIAAIIFPVLFWLIVPCYWMRLGKGNTGRRCVGKEIKRPGIKVFVEFTVAALLTPVVVEFHAPVPDLFL